MKKVIKFHKPKKQEECKHKHIRIDVREKACVCLGCGNEMNEYWLLEKFSKVLGQYRTVDINNLDFKAEQAGLSRSIKELESMRDDLSKDVGKLFAELHNLQIEIKEAKNQLKLF